MEQTSNKWETISLVGTIMIETTVRVDEKGRIMIPKTIRRAAKIKEGSCVNIKAEGKAIIIEPAEPVAEKFAGIFKIAKWPETLDGHAIEASKKWLQR